MLIIRGLDHIVLRTAQLAEMLGFYTGVLGCVVERQTSEQEGLVQLRAGDALIDLVAVDSNLGRQGGGPPSRTENNLDHFCLLLEPVSEQQITDYLSEKGIPSGEFSTRYGSEGFGPSVYLRDPDGNTLELRSARRPR